MPPLNLTSSSRASASAATLMSSNAIPWDERNSFVALHGPQVGLLKTRTLMEGSTMMPPVDRRKLQARRRIRP